ncbi:MAG: DMT family transporter [Tissierellaceae bacterium]
METRSRETSKYRLRVVGAMIIWGTIGIFVREISLRPIEIAFYRSFIGFASISLLTLFRRESFDTGNIKENIMALLGSGASLGLGWALLFQGYKYTSISNATLAYYIAPIIIIIMSAVLLKERITARKLACVVAAMVGLGLIVRSNELTSIHYNHKLGIFFALGGGFFYASLVIINKYVRGLPSSIITIIQLFMAAFVLLPYILVEGTAIGSLDTRSLVFLLIVGIVHTATAYIIYLSAVGHLEGQSLAILSYIDPIVALILSGLILKETMTLVQILGGLMILAAAFFSEYRRE